LLGEVLDTLLDKLNIFDAQFFADDVQIANRIHITLDVNNLSIIETSHDLIDGIDSADVGKEGIAESSTSRGATSETSDIVDSQIGRDDGLWLVL